MHKLVIASNNPGKLREFQAMLAPLGIEVLTQEQLGIAEAEEPHCTFIENALAKARHVSRESGLPALMIPASVLQPWAARPAYGQRATRVSPNRIPATMKSCCMKCRACLTGERIIIACWCWYTMPTIRSR
jgi:hypothetical protein